MGILKISIASANTHVMFMIIRIFFLNMKEKLGFVFERERIGEKGEERIGETIGKREREERPP